jgi:folate-dependent phosphoribosylglycinamide formyltransferase PurN
MPEEICIEHKIYNGHPGLITPVSEGGYGDLLKGKDPQWKAYTLKLPYSGSVIHQVSSEVDEGRVIMSSKVSLTGLDFDQILSILRETSLSLWKIFFKIYQ